MTFLTGYHSAENTVISLWRDNAHTKLMEINMKELNSRVIKNINGGVKEGGCILLPFPEPFPTFPSPWIVF